MQAYVLVGPITLTLASWALYLWGPADGREVFLGMAQVATAATFLLFAAYVVLRARASGRSARRPRA